MKYIRNVCDAQEISMVAFLAVSAAVSLASCGVGALISILTAAFGTWEQILYPQKIMKNKQGHYGQ